MPTSSGSSYFNRLVRNTRQAVTRRNRRPVEPTIPIESYTGPNHPPVDVFAPSNILGMFDNNNVPITSTYRPPYHPQTYHYDLDTEPGPSHLHNYSQPGYQTNNYTISAWTKDFEGQDIYVGHGKIEEVRSDVGESANHGPPSRSGLGPLLALNAGNHESNELLNDELAYLSTPPPCPRPRNLPSLQPTPTGSDYMHFKAPSVPAKTTTSSSPAPILSTEVHLVRNNLAMVELSLEDVQFMNTVFLSKSVEHDLSDHIDLCARIEYSLESLRRTLTHRTRIGAEEWSVRSTSWHQKHGDRLLSLKRTLQRLARLRQLIETHSLRSRQRIAIRTKLEQHEAKLADLASKYSATFDRLKLCHLHFLLTQSYDDARERRSLHKSRLTSRESFERRWNEGKTLRAVLRADFHDQRDNLYNTKTKSQLRSSRQTSVQ
ncbi:hypothetical protein BYT27DRAFT_7101590 [Phlegmacium glaucopus]|nr:hypothetical protein BYT27DRAFT_7101590 [Phlegmacium glaucopus]